MNASDPPEQTGQPRLVALHCRRIDQRIAPEEHAKCAYCFGKLDDVLSGRHEAFCGFVPGRDPVHFGFPDSNERDREG